MYTVRLTFRVVGTRLTIKTFIRSEYALNTSSHADTFDTLEQAENAADALVEQMTATGRVTYIGADFYRRPLHRAT